MKSDWIWLPHPAHFIGSKSCGFRMATYVNGVIVSTVGEYLVRGQPEEVGCNRFYETMVFKAKKGECRACGYVVADYTEIDSAGYNDPEEARSGHVSMCEKWDRLSLR